MNDNTKLYLIALYLINGVGDKTIATLIEHYNSIDSIFLDDENDIINALKTLVSRNRNKTYNFTKRELLDKANRIVDDSHKRGIDIVSIFDDEYPFNLRQIDNPPYILYMKGNKKVLRRNSIAVVGTRAPQKSSTDYTFELASALSGLNITVVSGFAKGVDTAAHLGALSAGGNTIAVFGCGLERIYPAENARMYNKMIEHSLILSEFAVGSVPDRANFPRRNRIISGLTYATVMVEAAERSGALITTNYALEHGRDVFVAPYNETKSAFMGNHKLYKDGARIANSYVDIISDFDNILSADSEYVKMKNRYFNGGIINSNIATVESSIDNVYTLDYIDESYADTSELDYTENNIEDLQADKTAEIEDVDDRGSGYVGAGSTSGEAIERRSRGDRRSGGRRKTAADNNAETTKAVENIEPVKKEVEIDYSNFNDNEKLVLNVISKNHDVHIDTIAEHVGNIAMGELAMILMQLEIKGVIRQNPGKSYILEK